MSKSKVIKSLILIVLCAILFSFSNKPGSHSFEIYVNNKLVLREYVNDKKEVASLPLNQDLDQDLSINYSHCGHLGTARNIIIKDEQNRVLKAWQFDDATSGPMTCKVKDIVAFGNGHSSLNLFYSSKELSKDQLLAAIHLEGKTARSK